MAVDNRRITVGAAGYKPDIVKQPGDTWAIILDCATWLGTETTVASASAAVWNPTPDAPTAAAPTVIENDKAVRILVSGGTDGYLGVMTVQITMLDGQVKEVEVQFAIVETDYVAPA